MPRQEPPSSICSYLMAPGVWCWVAILRYSNNDAVSGQEIFCFDAGQSGLFGCALEFHGWSPLLKSLPPLQSAKVIRLSRLIKPNTSNKCFFFLSFFFKKNHIFCLLLVYSQLSFINLSVQGPLFTFLVKAVWTSGFEALRSLKSYFLKTPGLSLTQLWLLF